MAFTDFYKPLNPIDPQIRMNPIQQQTAKDIYTFLENQRQQQQLNIQQQNAQIQQAQMQQQADARRVEAEKSREKALKQIEEQNAFKQALADLSERQKADPNMTIFQQQRVIRESLQGQGQVGLVKALDNKMLEAHTKSKDPVYQNAIQSGYFGGKAQTPEELAKLARIGKSPVMVADRPFDVATEKFIAPETIEPALEKERRLSAEEWNRRQQVLEKSKMAVKAAPSGASLGGGGGGGPEGTSAEELKLLSGVDAILNPPSGGGGGGGGGGVGAGAGVGVSADGAEVGVTPDITFTPEPTPGVASATVEPTPGVASETAIPMAAGPEQEIPKIMEALNYLSRITPQIKSKAGQAALRARRTELITKLNQANKQIARMEKEEEKKGKKLTPEAIEDHVKLNIATGKKPDISPRNMEAWTDYTNARAQYLRANNIPLWVILRNESNYEAKKKTVSFLDKKNAVMRGYVDTITSNIKDVKLGMELLKKEFGSSPLYNEFKQNFMTRVYASDPEKSAQVGRLRAALDIIAKEVANAVSNPNMVGVTPESIQQEMIKKLNAAQTYEQVMATLDLYEKDLMNRVNASQKTQDDAINSLSGLFPETAKNFQGWKPDQTTPLPVPPRGVKPVVNQYYQNSKGSILMHNGKTWIWIDKNE